MTTSGCVLADLGVIGIRGADALGFLQGQLSNDTARLELGGAQLSAYHNPQGRTICILRLVLREPGEVLGVLPTELLAPTLARLRKFVLRAKVTLSDESTAWKVCGFSGRAPALPGGSIGLDLAAAALDAGRGERTLALLPASSAPEVAADGSSTREAWRLRDIEAGLPQVYAATSETFVAQMLNLDVLGGIAFDKGCYTGQEVIARAHYRGRVKRRLQRFQTRAAATLAPGSRGRLSDGRAFTVVESVRLADGRAEFLAVAPFADLAEDSEAATAEDATAALECDQLELPYRLPA